MGFGGFGGFLGFGGFAILLKNFWVLEEGGEGIGGMVCLWYV